MVKTLLKCRNVDRNGKFRLFVSIFDITRSKIDRVNALRYNVDI